MTCSRRRLDWNFDECIFFQVVFLHHIEKKSFCRAFWQIAHYDKIPNQIGLF